MYALYVEEVSPRYHICAYYLAINCASNDCVIGLECPSEVNC